MNGVEKLEDWPVREYADLWARSHHYSKPSENRKLASYDQLEYMEQEQYGDMVIKERPLKSMLGSWIL